MAFKAGPNAKQVINHNGTLTGIGWAEASCETFFKNNRLYVDLSTGNKVDLTVGYGDDAIYTPNMDPGKAGHREVQFMNHPRDGSLQEVDVLFNQVFAKRYKMIDGDNIMNEDAINGNGVSSTFLSDNRVTQTRFNLTRDHSGMMWDDYRVQSVSGVAAPCTFWTKEGTRLINISNGTNTSTLVYANVTPIGSYGAGTGEFGADMYKDGTPYGIRVNYSSVWLSSSSYYGWDGGVSLYSLVRGLPGQSTSSWFVDPSSTNLSQKGSFVAKFKIHKDFMTGDLGSSQYRKERPDQIVYMLLTNAYTNKFKVVVLRCTDAHDPGTAYEVVSIFEHDDIINWTSDTSPKIVDCQFSEDGFNFYFMDGSSSPSTRYKIHQLRLLKPFDLQSVGNQSTYTPADPTTSYTSISLTAGFMIDPYSHGQRFLIHNGIYTAPGVYMYDMSTPWEIDTSSYTTTVATGGRGFNMYPCKGNGFQGYMYGKYAASTVSPHYLHYTNKDQRDYVEYKAYGAGASPSGLTNLDSAVYSRFPSVYGVTKFIDSDRTVLSSPPFKSSIAWNNDSSYHDLIKNYDSDEIRAASHINYKNGGAVQSLEVDAYAKMYFRSVDKPIIAKMVGYFDSVAPIEDFQDYSATWNGYEPGYNE